jgi:hypothetical protein
MPGFWFRLLFLLLSLRFIRFYLALFYFSSFFRFGMVRVGCFVSFGVSTCTYLYGLPLQQPTFPDSHDPLSRGHFSLILSLILFEFYFLSWFLPTAFFILFLFRDPFLSLNFSYSLLFNLLACGSFSPYLLCKFILIIYFLFFGTNFIDIVTFILMFLVYISFILLEPLLFYIPFCMFILFSLYS